MAIRELDPGQQHTFALTALLVEVTGASGAGVVLRALDRGGAEIPVTRLTPTELLLTPQPRRLRLVAAPGSGGAFAPGSTLGLMVRTEGAAVATEQVMVASADVGALPEHELAVVEFAADRSVLRVSGAVAPSPPPKPDPGNPGTESTADSGRRPAEPVGATPPAVPVVDDGADWLREGRYALREAVRTHGERESSRGTWALVLDGSASVRALLGQGLEELVTLVAGIQVEHSGSWPLATVVAGIVPADVPSARQDPLVAVASAFGDGVEPSSWSTLSAALQMSLRLVGPFGQVVVVTDGVPGDVDDIAALVDAAPAARFTIVASGSSALGLQSDGAPDWWGEELGALVELASRENVRVASVACDESGIRLDGTRPAELAAAFTRAAAGAPQ